MRYPLLVAVLSIFIVSDIRAADSGFTWSPVFADNFDRPLLGENWRWVFGSGRQHLVDNAVRLSHNSTMYCVVPLPQDDVRVEFRVLLPTKSFDGQRERHSISLELRGGEVGAGGNQERFELLLIPGSEPGDPATDPVGTIRIGLDETYDVAMQICGGVGSAEINGQQRFQKQVGTAHSEINRFFVFSTKGLNSTPGHDAALDDFRILAGPRSVARLPLQTNTADENRQATRHAVDFMDPANPAAGIQRAIDALPSSGGVVILPPGELLMRRHLRLRNHVTLRGQGAGKTILKAVQGERGSIVKLATTGDRSTITMSAADAAKFRPGDGVCFEQNWGHPGEINTINKDCIVTSVDGHFVTVGGVPPTSVDGQPIKELSHWFPMVYAHCAEFVELKDLTITGGVGGWGGFQSSAVTFGQVAGARVSRVQITNWEGDGISIQTSGDTIVADSTVSNAYQGYHPGTITQRFLWTRNLGLGNRSSGLYFCWHNRNGVYHRNTLDRFDGYGWPGDSFNVIDRNHCPSPDGFAVEQGEGGGGVVFNNRYSQIRIGHGQADAPTFDFVIARNQADELRFVAGEVQRNLIAGNLSGDRRRPTAIRDARGKNLVVNQGADLELGRFPVGAERTGPVGPPVYREPILDGAAYYRPDAPAAGFQDALNQLAGRGGTLLLPAGRYPLAQPLKVPSNVTLAGSGLSTVLHAAKPDQPTSIVIANKAHDVTIRDLVIIGEYNRRDSRSPGIVLEDVRQGELSAIDVRGWEGTAVKVSGGSVQIRDCRALGCAGEGFQLSRCRFHSEGNIARECAQGFVVSRGEAGSALEANIAAGNRGNGFQVAQSANLRVYANNANFNNQHGIYADNAENVEFVANMIANNNQSSAEAGGVRLAGHTTGCRLFYNNFQDTQNQATQKNAVIEESAAGRNRIQFNLAGAKFQIDGKQSTVSDNFIPGSN